MTLDLDHVRLVQALERLGRGYKTRAQAQIRRIASCNHSYVVEGDPLEDGSPRGSKTVVRGWHCKSPLCPRASAAKSEKLVAQYMVRAMTRVKFGHKAVTLTLVPQPGQSLADAFLVMNRARARLFRREEFRRMVHGGMFRLDMTMKERSTVRGKPERSWFVHMHLLVDANLNAKRIQDLSRSWSRCVSAEGGEAPTAIYSEDVKSMDAYMRYMRKSIDYSEWTDDELLEGVQFLMSVRPPKLTGVFGSWSDRTREGKPYKEAKKEIVEKIKESEKTGVSVSVPKIDFSDIHLVTRTNPQTKRETLLGINPDVRGHGLEAVEAAAAELICISIRKYFYNLRSIVRKKPPDIIRIS